MNVLGLVPTSDIILNLLPRVPSVNYVDRERGKLSYVKRHRKVEFITKRVPAIIGLVSALEQRLYPEFQASHYSRLNNLSIFLSSRIQIVFLHALRALRVWDYLGVHMQILP
jgi:hypothetical protein